jgi:anhydro-N-acetylmuramic acid kinase
MKTLLSLPMKSILTLGIMSGTSIDGVDYALCDIGQERLQLRALWSVAFPAALRRRLHCAARGDAPSWEVGQLHHDLGRFYAEGVRRAPGFPQRGSKPRLAGLHGQTIFHNPDHQAPATLQIGEPAYLARELGVPVINNFRAADLAAGGEGAPLATSFHVRAFGVPRRHICVNNLGGISNVTSIDWRRGSSPRVMAFDTGPANVLLDLAARTFSGGRSTFDRDGRAAASGQCCEALVARWLRHPYFRKSPPKSTGREMFGERFFEGVLPEARERKLSGNDLLATLTEFTARSLALNYSWHLPSAPEVVILAGGGAQNPQLCRAIARSFGSHGMEATVMSVEDVGWPVASVEAAAFAWLAWLRYHGRPGNLPSTTGATKKVLCGQITQ